VQNDFTIDDRLAAGLTELAVDHRDAVRAGADPADGQDLAAILAEALAVGAGLGADHRFQEALALRSRRGGPMGAESRLPHEGQIEVGDQDGPDTGLAVRTGLGLDQRNDLARGFLDESGSGAVRSLRRRCESSDGEAQNGTTRGELHHRSLLMTVEGRAES